MGNKNCLSHFHMGVPYEWEWAWCSSGTRMVMGIGTWKREIMKIYLFIYYNRAHGIQQS